MNNIKRWLQKNNINYRTDRTEDKRTLLFIDPEEGDQKIIKYISQYHNDIVKWSYRGFADSLVIIEIKGAC